MTTHDPQLSQTYSYLALRKAVGLIGILLPFVLMTGLIVIFREKTVLRTISLYYHSQMRDIFVGALCSIALFLFFYKGYCKWDNIAANLAAFFALGIAFFPTVQEGPLDWKAWIHFISASLFFITLSCFSIFLFTRKNPHPTINKLARNKIYISCGVVMIVCLISILIFFVFLEKNHPDSSFVFWIESLALIAFGISWLTKGGTIFRDEKKLRINLFSDKKKYFFS
jgi:hypothetical protein